MAAFGAVFSRAGKQDGIVAETHPVPSDTKSSAPTRITPGITSNAPTGADAAILASYPVEVQDAVNESKQQEGTRTVTVGDDLWIIITPGNKPGAAVTILPVENKNGAVEVVYSIKPLTGGVSATGLNPQPFNVMLVKGAAKAKVTFRKVEPGE